MRNWQSSSDRNACPYCNCPGNNDLDIAEREWREALMHMETESDDDEDPIEVRRRPSFCKMFVTIIGTGVLLNAFVAWIIREF
jgi:hypothetical protein